MHFAAQRGDLALIKFLLDRGADIEARESHECTPLIRALFGDEIEAALILMYKGADMFTVDENGCGIIHWAAYRNNVDALRIFRLHGFDMNIQTVIKNRETPLHLAVRNEAVFAIEYLINADVDLDIRDSEGCNAEEFARKRGYNDSLRVMKKFLAAKAPNPLHQNFSILFIAYYVLLYMIYYVYVLPWTAYHIFASLTFVTVVI